MLAQIAHHYLQALPMGDADRAGLCAMRAAEAAMAALAYEQAARLYRTTLGTLDAHGAELDRLHLELLLKLGEAEGRARNFHDSRETFRQAAETSRRNGSAEGFARSVLGYGMMGADPGRTDQHLVGLINEALRMAGPSRPALRATLLARLAEEVRWTAPAEETERLIDEAVSIARDYADPPTLVDALYIKFLIIRGPATAQQRLNLSSEMLQMAMQHQLSNLYFNLRYHRAAVLLELGDISAVDNEIREMNRLPEGILHQHLGFPELIDSMRALMEGRLDDAERLALQALEIGRRRPNSVADQIFVLQSLLIKREAGVLAEGVALLERVIAQHSENLAMRCLLGFCYAETDRRSLAKAEFESLAVENFTQVPLDFRWLLSISFLAEICSYLDDKPRAMVLYDLLLPYASRSASIGLFGYAGSVSYYLALLASTMEKFAEAENHFHEAIEFETRMIARPTAARTRYRYAATLAQRNDRHAHQRALEMVRDALSIAEAFNLPDLRSRSRTLESSLVLRVSASPAVSDQAASSGRLLTFRKEGELWVIGSPDKIFRLRDSKGLGYIAQLLRQPGVEFHSLNLIADVMAQSDERDSFTAAAHKMGGERLADINLSPGFPDHAGPMLDPQAKAAYKRRLAELKEELEDARESSNSGRADELEEEIEALNRELLRAFNVRDRERYAGSASERARIAVVRAIKTAIEKITEQDAEIGLLFRHRIRTGTFCSFVVGTESAQISWDL
jgi:tetratricopeptide (TPR) repeat protein